LKRSGWEGSRSGVMRNWQLREGRELPFCLKKGGDRGTHRNMAAKKIFCGVA